MVVNDIGKTAILCCALLGVFGLVALGRVAWTDVDWLVGGIVGVFIGNGAVAARKRAPSPMIVASMPNGEAVDDAGQQYTLEAHGDGAG